MQLREAVGLMKVYSDSGVFNNICFTGVDENKKIWQKMNLVKTKDKFF